jgi:hypothetical protein
LQRDLGCFVRYSLKTSVMPLSVLNISGLSGHEDAPAPMLVTVAEDDRRETFVVTVPRGAAFVAPQEVASSLERSGLTMADLRVMSTSAHG